MNHDEMITHDLLHIWHPCAQMKDYLDFPPLMINKARGSYLELGSGKKIIDAISSWWCKSLGHNHPRLKKALKLQLERFEHVLLANTTNETIVALAKKLATLTPSLHKSFFAGDGSCSVEIALKMSLHARLITGEIKRKRFIALTNGYHGETIGAMSVSDLGLYKDPYQALLFNTHFITPPYLNNMNDFLWIDCTADWEKIEKSLLPLADEITAVIIEPILQGAGGMKIYSQDFLKRLRAWTHQNNIHLIADEIMTGIGRTGKMLACEHAGIEPDFLCLSKGLTSGFLPFSVTLTSDKIYSVFYDDYAAGKSFLHSHTFCGNPLAASVALEVLTIFEEQKLVERANKLGKYMLAAMQTVSEKTRRLKNIRQIGAVVAADLDCNDPNRRLGFEVYQQAVKLGALLRPLGNTIYWLPPLNMPFNAIEKLQNITILAIEATKR